MSWQRTLIRPTHLYLVNAQILLKALSLLVNNSKKLSAKRFRKKIIF
jgi:hypothetical protein